MGPGEARLFKQGEPLTPSSDKDNRRGRRTDSGPVLNGSHTGLMSPGTLSKSISEGKQIVGYF